MKVIARSVLTCVLTVGVMNTAAAYVGPGAGLSLLGALWGLLAAVFAALAFVLLWPLRRIIKARREKGTPTQARADEPAEPSPLPPAPTPDSSHLAPGVADLAARSKHPAQQA